jgi:hypothetical protein
MWDNSVGDVKHSSLKNHALHFSFLLSSFSFGVLHLMLPEAPQPYGLLYYPRIGQTNFLHQFRAATPLSRESLSCNPVI